jgi:hypothetical protein
MKRQFCMLAVIILASTAVFADVARPDKTPNRVPKPKPTPGVMTHMEIKLDRNATEARLIIPKQQLKQLRAELEQLDDGSDSTAAASTVSFSRVQTIMSGAFLSLAFIFAGIWFARSGKAATKTGKSLVVLAAIAGAASAVTFVYGNAGPPPEARSITSKMFAQGVHYYKMGWGEVRLEIGEGEQINFIVPDPQPSPTPGE